MWSISEQYWILGIIRENFLFFETVWHFIYVFHLDKYIFCLSQAEVYQSAHPNLSLETRIVAETGELALMQVVEGELFSTVLDPDNCLDLMQCFCSQVCSDVGDSLLASINNHVIQISPSVLWLCLHDSRIISFYALCLP